MRLPISLQQLAQQPDKGHGGGNLPSGPRSLLELVVQPRLRQREGCAAYHPLGQKAAECAPPLQHVADLGTVGTRVVVRGIFQLPIRNRKFEPVAEFIQLIEIHLLELVCHILAEESLAQRPAFDRLGETTSDSFEVPP